MKITLENYNLQALYTLASMIWCKNIKEVRQLKAIFMKIQWQTEDFEREWEKLAFEVNLRKETISQFKQTWKINEKSDEIEKLHAEINWFVMDIDNLKMKEVEIEINADDVKFLLENIDVLMTETVLEQVGQGQQPTANTPGVYGKRSIDSIDAIYTALENAI